MKNKKQFTDLLSEKIKTNIITEYVGRKENEDIFRDNKERLFTLLLDHPYFQKQVKRLRELYKIPKEGFKKTENVYKWEYSTKNIKKNFVKDIESLVSEFSISNIYRQNVWFFFYNFITNPKQDYKDLIEALPVFSIVKTDTDREINKYLINPDSTYIEIFDWTTKSDMEKLLKKINENKKKNKSPFNVSRVGNLPRMVWKMSQDGLKDKKITEEINKSFFKNGEKRTLGYEEISVYRNRYKKALSSLRKTS